MINPFVCSFNFHNKDDIKLSFLLHFLDFTHYNLDFALSHLQAEALTGFHELYSYWLGSYLGKPKPWSYSKPNHTVDQNRNFKL